MATYVVEPAGEGKYPGIVLYHAVLGLMPIWRDIAEEIATGGYVFVLPDMYHRLGRLELFPNWPENRDEAFAAAASTNYETWREDSRVALDYLKSLPKVDSERIGTYGHCYGGGAAFVTATQNPDVKAALLVCPSGMVNRALSEQTPVPPFELVPNLNASVMCLSGSADQNPSPADVQLVAERMAAAGKHFEYHIYEGDPPAGHAFFERDLPMFNPGAVEWAWPLKLDFLRRMLQEPRVPAGTGG
jgi:carboxymethylenebutenolidase